VVASLACALVALTLAGQPDGGKYLETVLQDDAVFLHERPADVRAAARQVAALGVDRVRITASWSDLAPAPRSRHMPGGDFRPTDSRTYPPDRLRALDTAVKAVRDAGMAPQLDLAFWAPRWATRAPSKNRARQRTWIVPERFAEFSRAVARRYSGEVDDPAGPGKLPAVDRYTTWNEPNHPSFLAPQWRSDGRGGFRPASPHVYRAMHDLAYDAIKAVAPRSEVLLGGTASTGSTVPGRGGVPPLQFVRALACVDATLQPLDVDECRGFRPLRADGFAHHPYSRYTTPGASSANPDDVPIADTGRLSALLDQLAAAGRITGRLPIFQTEYGYETSQDDPFNAPFDRDDQAAFLGWSTYLAWKDPHTRSMAQFLLRDIDPDESGRPPGTRGFYRDWQSGLLTAAGHEKPALQAFKLPFWPEVDGEGDRRVVRLFGEVRPGRGRQVVLVERLDPGTGAWRPVPTFGPACGGAGQHTFLTDRSGFFLRAAAFEGPGTYRLSWKPEGGGWQSGPPIPLAGADGLAIDAPGAVMAGR
jgi:hypothetical protein